MRIPEKMDIAEHEFRVVFGRTKIDFDPNKENANQRRHGYSLESAVSLLRRIIMPAGLRVLTW